MHQEKIRLLNSKCYKLVALFLALLIAGTVTFAYSQNIESQANLSIDLDKLIERKIASGEKHNYQIALSENQFAAIVVEQRGIDVAVRLFDKTAKRALVQRDSITKTEGLEKVDFVATTAGEYRLEIEAKTNAAGGDYTILLSALRLATERELRLEEARKLHNEAIRLWNEGEYKEALPIAERALEIRERESSADDIDVAASLASLALIVMDRGDYDRAISLYKRALKIREKNFGIEHPEVARTIHNMAIVYMSIGDYGETVKLYEKAIEIREKVLGPDSAELATSLNNLGIVYAHLAEYAKAEQFMQRALEIKQKTLPSNSPSIAASYSTLASVFSDKGDEDKALEFYRRSLEIREKALRPEHPDIARSLSYLATSYAAKGDYEKAEVHYLRALVILRKAFGEDHQRIAMVLGSLAILYQQRNDYAKAEPLFLQTIAMLEKTAGKEKKDYATALFNLAEFYAGTGNYQKAEPLYRQALSIAETKFGAQHPDVITYLNGLAKNHQAKGETNQAVTSWARARKLSERNTQIILFTNSERQKLLFLNTLAGETNQYISSHVKFAPEDMTALELALTTIFERKGRVSDATAFEFAALRNRFDKDDQILLDKLKETTAQLAQKVLNEPQDVTLEEHQKQISDLEERKENLEVEISRRSTEFRSQIQPVSIAAIQAEIPENAVLIEFSIYQPFDPKATSDSQAYGDSRYVAYILRRRGAIRWADLGPAKTIDAAVEAFRQALRDPKRKDVPALARALDEKVMQPIRGFIENAAQILVSPDGELNLIPFEALVDEQNRYLIEKYAFSYVTSGRDLLRMRVSRESKNRSLVIANPDFGESAAEQTAKVNFMRKTRRQSVTATRDLSDTYFAPISGTAQEARSIQILFPKAAFLMGAQATETALKQIVAPRILHIATHGFFLEDYNSSAKAQTNRGKTKLKTDIENPLLRSGLALAGANQRNYSAKNDGILTALEASNLNLWGTKLVVLSACDTGVGEVKNGEGVYGFRRAFILAGAESSVMSLWPVSDYATRELMTNYYKNLKQGAGRGAALRQVQLEMLKRKEREHPFFWAGFIQSGEWANLDGKR